MNAVGYFEIQSENIERSIAFYSTIFEWGFIKDEMVSITYFQIKGAGINGGLLQRPSKTSDTEKGANAFVCSIQVKDFDTTTDKILKNGGSLVLEKFAIPGRCYQGYFLDPEGNTFGIFQVDTNAT
jgi:predicted enzyme related to lactoylglutathione lyase